MLGLEETIYLEIRENKYTKVIKRGSVRIFPHLVGNYMTQEICFYLRMKLFCH